MEFDAPSLRPDVERIYPLTSSDAFKTVNAAVHLALSRLSFNARPPRDETAGAVTYAITNQAGMRAQLHVLHVTDRIASLRLYLVEPVDPAQERALLESAELRRQSAEAFGRLFDHCHAGVVDLLRTAAAVGDPALHPPCPPASDLGAVFAWAEVYAPHLTDKQLAEQIGIAHGTIRNARLKQRTLAQIEAKTPRGKLMLRYGPKE